MARSPRAPAPTRSVPAWPPRRGVEERRRHRDLEIYRTAPAGWYTYMVDLGPDHAVRDVHQVLDEPYFGRIQPGLSRDQVRRLLGAPKDVAEYKAKNEEVWSWRYKEANNWYRLFNVAFDASSGTVLRTLPHGRPLHVRQGRQEQGLRPRPPAPARLSRACSLR